MFHSAECDEQASITSLPVLGCCSVHEFGGTFWLSDLVFTGLSDVLGLSDNENLFTVLISILPHQIFTSLPVLIMNSQLLFADSLTSTLLDSLGKSTTSLLEFQKNTSLTVFSFQHVDVSYGIGIYPSQVSPCLSGDTLAWHSWRCHDWWDRRAWGRRRMINFLPWRCHGCWRGQATGRTRW